MVMVDLGDVELPQTFNLLKEKNAVSEKYNKASHACSPLFIWISKTPYFFVSLVF